MTDGWHELRAGLRQLLTLGRILSPRQTGPSSMASFAQPIGRSSARKFKMRRFRLFTFSVCAANRAVLPVLWRDPNCFAPGELSSS